MKKWYLVFLILFTVSVLALPPPPEAPGGFGKTIATDKFVEDLPPNIPDTTTSSETSSTQGKDLSLKLMELEKKINKLESNTGMLSTPYIILLSINLVLIGFVFYLFYLIRPHQPYQ